MKKFLSSLGATLVLVSVFVLGWSVGQPDPYKMEIKLLIMDKRFYACDFEIGQCAYFTTDQVQRLLLRAGIYESL